MTPAGELLLEKTFREVMTCVYLWMASGLALTATVAVSLAQSEAIAQAVYDKPIIYTGLFVAQMVLVMAISGGINKMAPATALGLFFIYSALMGATLSTLFLVYDLGTIGPALISAAAMFTAMSIIGLTTEADLTGWGNALFAALIGLIIALFANILFQSNGLEWVVSIAGVVIFIGLTVYDTQAIKTLTAEALADLSAEVAAGRVGVLGALTLYLDFLNRFLFILSLLGDDD